MKILYAIAGGIVALCIAYGVGYYMGAKSTGAELRGEYERAVANIAAIESNLEDAKNVIDQLTRERDTARIHLEGIRTANERARGIASNTGGAIGRAIYTTEQLDALLERGERIAGKGAGGKR